ncbi:MurR/RpiR family transcriptional regulator [Endozoicomonas elysicola]|uniref:RpiR family transcriptional regulator n=1 Tax=Endozoicomonas elysicola TaxID=305900 RepID=A0A081KGM5_9GAMM|nr:MurR/RpiR family transcriptional regulator [Endozoicomonas elysicola]KEI73301.1 hypothetical protein GV64_23575 [Endozoicomonas elysicola]
MKQDSDYGLLARLRSRFDHLSPALAKINRFVTEHPDTVIHQTLIELAETSGASEASVVRFCRDSGFKSFSEFRIALSTSLVMDQHEHALNKSSEEHIEFDIASLDNVELGLKKTMDALNDTCTLLDIDALTKASNSIINAGNLYFFGVGASAVIAQYGQYRLMRLGFNTTGLTNMHSAIMTVACMKKDDVILLISGSGNTRDLLTTAQKALIQQGVVIAITGNPKSELAKLSQVCLHTSVTESFHSAGAFSSKLAQLFVMDALVNKIVEQRPELRRNFAQTAESIVFSQ